MADDEPVGRQPLRALPDRGAAHVEALGQVDLDEAAATTPTRSL
ncbi:MAG TPA: hypothetical protein VI248_13175 [Kineosporiaceae bacterium]